MTYGDDRHAASAVRRGSQVFLLNPARQCFHYSVRGPSFTYMVSRETSHLPSKAQPVGNGIAAFLVTTGAFSKRLEILTLAPSCLYSFPWGMREQKDRTESAMALPFQLECIYNQFPGLVCYLLNGRPRRQTLFLNSSVKKY